jgi:hypothetical protein
MNKIAKAMGYSGDMGQFQSYIEQDPMRQQQMQRYTNAAMQMAKGGVVRKMRTGGFLESEPKFYTPQQGETLLRNTPTPGRRYTTVMPATGGQFAFKSDGTRVTVPQGYFNQQTGGIVTDPNSKFYGQPAPPPSDITQVTAPFLGTPPAATPPAATPPAAQTQPNTIREASIQRMYQPGVPVGGVVQAAQTAYDTAQYVDPRVGLIGQQQAIPTAYATVTQATPQAEKEAAQVTAVQAAPAVDVAVEAAQAAQAVPDDPRAQITAAQQATSSVGNLQEAQGNAILIDNPVQRDLQAGELISGAAADATKAAQFTEQVEAAQATPSQQATVQGQLAQLTANFDAKNPPAWAAGALRSATQQMAARGLGASSIAGQAIVQATIEAALPVAQADARTFAAFETQNLSNRQQRAMLAAQQRAEFMGMEFTQEFQARVQNAARISDIANMNFTAEQQIQLENSKVANTVNLQNLSNSQAMVMAEAAALAQLDTSNLNNRQQSAVQNAQAFMQRDMANLSNRQQTELFKSQQRIQSILTDQAATNAARQFNASSENQVVQFFANLANQTNQFNASQANAQSQFNAGQRNTVERFNAEIANQRDQFNAQNQLVIAQSNAQWRREIATADTAAVNRANELNATNVLNISKQAYDNLWTYYADTMEFAWKSAENELDRLNSMAIAQLSADAQAEAGRLAAKSGAGKAIGGLIGTLGTAALEFGLPF